MYIKKEDVAEMFGVSTRTIDRWIESRGLPAIKVEKTIRFEREKVREWFDAQHQESK